MTPPPYCLNMGMKSACSNLLNFYLFTLFSSINSVAHHVESLWRSTIHFFVTSLIATFACAGLFILYHFPLIIV